MRWRAVSLSTDVSNNQHKHHHASSTKADNIEETPALPNPKLLNKLLHPMLPELRQLVFDVMHEPLFRRQYGLTMKQHRILTQMRLARLTEIGLFKRTLTSSGSSRAKRVFTIVEAISLLDHSLESKFGVSVGLFGESISSLGTDSQAAYWLPKIENWDEVGCFALTELGHGSNTRDIETTAYFNQHTDQFVIHTPSETAQKYWIGGAADTATVAVVFARLCIPRKQHECNDKVMIDDHGLHAFIVRLRDPITGAIQPGITISDCGSKAGLNGVDNGRIWFSNVRIARSALLSRLSRVTRNGKFETSIPSDQARFAAMLAGLTGGRVLLCGTCTSSSLLGLTIAIKYSQTRRAFAPPPGTPEQKEVPLLFYTSQRRLLFPHLATSIMYLLCSRDLYKMWYKIADGGPFLKDMHILSSGYKALFTTAMYNALQASREACGGQGYKSDNEIGVLKADRDVMLTFEGDNCVLLQQIGKHILSEHSGNGKNNKYISQLKAEQKLSIISHSSQLLDVPFIQNAFHTRQKFLTQQLVQQYQHAMARHKGNTFFAWNDCLPIAERAGIAYLHTRLYEGHLCHVEKARSMEKASAEAVALCGRLWAATIIAHDPDFLTTLSITPEQATAIQNAIDPLCERMMVIAPILLEAVGIPDHLLVPIAKDWMTHNSRARL